MKLEISNISDAAIFNPVKEREIMYFSVTDFVCDFTIEIDGDVHILRQEPVIYFFKYISLALFSSVLFGSDDYFSFHTYNIGIEFKGRDPEESGRYIKCALCLDSRTKKEFLIEDIKFGQMILRELKKLVTHLMEVHSYNEISSVINFMLLPNNSQFFFKDEKCINRGIDNK